MADSDFRLSASPDIVVEESDNEEETEVLQVCYIILICGVFKKVLLSVLFCCFSTLNFLRFLLMLLCFDLYQHFFIWFPYSLLCAARIRIRRIFLKKRFVIF